jgi:polyisoprenoid-binding protein YceI
VSTADSSTHHYVIDKAHSEVSFTVRHLVTKVRGHFRDFDGSIHLNEAHPEQSRVQIDIKTDSIDTKTPDRDAHLRSADFFHVEEHPVLSFKSTKVRKNSAEDFVIEGDLSIRGTTNNIHLPTTFLGHAKDPWGGARIGFESEVTINRKDYGLVWNAALETGGFLVGDEVKIHLSIQAVKQ